MIEERIQSTFRFDRYIVEQMRFDRNEEYSRSKVKLDFSISTAQPVFHEDEERYIGEVCLMVSVFPEAKKQDYPFEFFVSMKGIFSMEISNDMNNSLFKKRLLQNGLAILFPYARAIVSDMTRMGNVNPVILPSINIIEYLKRFNANSKIQNKDE